MHTFALHRLGSVLEGGKRLSFSLYFSLFFVIIVFYIVIVQVLVVLFRITGLTEEKARFQVISLLTNSGYTTKESELIVDVMPRRKLARGIMLFGYTFSITVVSVFVNMMVSLPASEKNEVWPALIIVSALFVVFLIVWRIPIVKTAMNSVVERLGRKWIYGDQRNTILVQDEYPRGVVAQVTLNSMPQDVKGKTLHDLQLPEKYGIHVVLVNRNGVLEVDTDGKTILQEGDVATVFGPIKAIRHVFENKPDSVSHLAMAPKPESAEEFIHNRDVAEAKRAAQKEHAELDASAKQAGHRRLEAAPGGAEEGSQSGAGENKQSTETQPSAQKKAVAGTVSAEKAQQLTAADDRAEAKQQKDGSSV